MCYYNGYHFGSWMSILCLDNNFRYSMGHILWYGQIVNKSILAGNKFININDRRLMKRKITSLQVKCEHTGTRSQYHSKSPQMSCHPCHHSHNHLQQQTTQQRVVPGLGPNGPTEIGKLILSI